MARDGLHMHTQVQVLKQTRTVAYTYTQEALHFALDNRTISLRVSLPQGKALCVQLKTHCKTFL